MDFLAGRLCESGVQSAAAWLDLAARTLNPQGTPDHSIAVPELQAFLSTAPPPPPVLQEQWSRQVLVRPGEPHEVHLLRCLARRNGRTRLSPHFALKMESHGEEAPSSQPSSPPTQTLFYDRCMVVGWRVSPAVKDYIETGWDYGNCPCCGTGGAGAAAPSALCENARCGSCGRTLPVAATTEEVSYMVVQCGARTRTAAVAYGKGALQHLALGASVRALLYHSQTEQHQPLLVVHVAEPCPPAAPQLFRNVSPAAAATGMHAGDQHGYFRSFYDDLQARYMAQRWDSAALSLDEVAEGVAPRLQGQTRAKTMVLLAVLHALYAAQNFINTHPRRPLHLLLVGPAKSGKTALLSGATALMGLHAEELESTVVRGAGRGEGARADGEASFLSALPHRRHDLLMAGLGMTATTLVLDPLPATASATAVGAFRTVLEHKASDAWDNRHAVPTTQITAQLIAAADVESAAAVQLAPSFSLVVAVAPANSQGDSAVISQDVVAASRVRATSSNSASRSVSGSRWPAPSTSPGPGTSPLRRAPRVEARADRVGCLTAEDLQYIVQRAADPAVLDAAVSPAVCMDAYGHKLAVAVSLIKEARAPTRSSMLHQSATSFWQSVKLHMDVLQRLSQARLLLVPAEDVRRTGLTTAMRDEVWRLYEHYLVTMGDLVQRRGGRGEHAEPCQSAGPARGRAGLPGPAEPRISKKQRRLRFLEELRTCQAHSSAEGCRGVTRADVTRIFCDLGGSAAFGDPAEVVMAQLQAESVVLAQLGGWRIM